MTDEFDPFDTGDPFNSEDDVDPFDPFDPGTFDPDDPGGDDPDPWEDPWEDPDPGDEPDPGGDTPGGGGSSSTEEVFYEEDFTSPSYYGSGAPNYVPASQSFPVPSGQSAGIRYISKHMQNKTITVTFSYTKNLDNALTIKKDTIQGVYPLVKKVSKYGQGTWVIISSFRSWVNSNTFPNEIFGGGAYLCLYANKYQIVNGVVSATGTKTLLGKMPLFQNTGEDSDFDYHFGRALAGYSATEGGYKIDPPKFYIEGNAPSEAGTLSVSITYDFYDTIPYCQPPTITLTSYQQIEQRNGELSPQTVGLTIKDGYQLVFSSNRYLLQRRQTNDGFTFTSWEDVSLTGATTTRTTVLVPAYRYNDGRNEWDEAISAEKLSTNINLSKASPDVHGATYQYRARLLPNVNTGDTDWITCYIGANNKKSHWQFTDSELAELEQAGAAALSPWSATVECQRLVKILPPSDVRVNPTKGRKTVEVSWKISDVSSFQNRFQSTIDYYIVASYKDDNNNDQSIIAFKATLPASKIGRAFITFTNDATQPKGFLGKIPNATPPKTIRFTVYAVYAGMQSENNGWADFKFIKGGVRYWHNGEWRDCTVFYYHNNQWIECTPFYWTNNQWVECGT